MTKIHLWSESRQLSATRLMHFLWTVKLHTLHKNPCLPIPQMYKWQYMHLVGVSKWHLENAWGVAKSTTFLPTDLSSCDSIQRIQARISWSVSAKQKNWRLGVDIAKQFPFLAGSSKLTATAVIWVIVPCGYGYSRAL